MNIIYSRRSIRKFEQMPIKDELVTELLMAGMAAPSAKDRKPWEFLVVTDRDKLTRLTEAHPFASFAKDAGAVIFVFGSPVGELFDQDLAAATENILIAASGLGLGTCWCGVTDERRPAIHHVTGIPGAKRIVTMICVGYPAEQKPARTQYDAAKVHYEEYRKEQTSTD